MADVAADLNSEYLLRSGSALENVLTEDRMNVSGSSRGGCHCLNCPRRPFTTVFGDTDVIDTRVPRAVFGRLRVGDDFTVVDDSAEPRHVCSRHTRFSLAVKPSSARSSAMNRYPNPGSSRWASKAALIRCASSQSRWLTGALSHL